MPVHRAFALTALGVLLLAAAPTSATGPTQSAPSVRIQPGALLGETCTLNMIFEDQAGTLYAGTAGHCVEGVGARVILAGLGEFGTVAYESPLTIAGLAQGKPQLDFALIRIDADRYGIVDPSVKVWGGPTAVAAELLPATPTLHYGQGLVFQSTEATRARMGVMEYTTGTGVFMGWWHGVFPFLGGDSGSPVLTVDGRALGYADIVTPSFSTYSTQAAAVSGPTFARVLEWLANDGWDLRMVTAPIEPPTEVALRTAEHCAATPIATDSQPDGCYRDTYRVYREVTPEKPVLWWHERGWEVGETGDPALCVQVPFSADERTCQTSILIVAGPADLWATNAGGVYLNVTWHASDGDVDVYVSDGNGQLVASAATSTLGKETLFMPELPPGEYRVDLVPRGYSDLASGGQGENVLATLHATPRAP